MSRTAEGADKFRKTVVAPFYIRGNIRRKLFSTRKPLAFHNDHEIPVYQIAPNYNIGSRQWVSLLHATVHAAVGRAVNRGGIRWENWKKTRIGQLPALSVFGPSLETRRGVKYKIGYYKRRIGAAKNTFRQFKPEYMEAAVHGEIKRTFNEGYLDVAISSGKLYFNQDKIFDVALTKIEFKQIVSKMEARLKKIGSSIDEVHSLDVESKEHERGMQLIEKAYKTKTPFTAETTPTSALNYAFYIEAAEVLTNKLVKKGISWVCKNLPEK